MWFGNVTASDTITIPWDVVSLQSGSVTPTTAGSIVIYKNNSATQRTSASGVTDTRTFDSVTGTNLLTIDLSDNADAGFYAAGNNYHVMVSGMVVEGLAINQWIASFSIQNRNDYADVREWLGTAVATPTTGGVPEVDITHIAGSAVSTSSAQIGVNVVNAGGTAWASGSLTSGVFAAGAITAAAIADGAIDAATFAADVDAEFLNYIVDDATRIDASALNTATATTIPAIVADTNELQTDWANGGRLDTILDARASQASVDTIDGIVDAILVDTAEIGAAGAGLTVLATAANLATVAGYLDTEIAAILEDTGTTLPAQITALNNLSQADIRAAVGLASANLDTQLTAIDDYLDTEVAAIKAKTDNLPASPAATGDAMTLTSAYDFAKGTVAMTEAYAANGAAPTPVQAIFAIHQMLMQHAISGTTWNAYKLDNVTVAFAVTLNDATTPTSARRT